MVMEDREMFIPSAKGRITGRKLIGHCKDCKHWQDSFCLRNDPQNQISSDDWISLDCLETGALQVGPMFGCINWEAKE